MDRSFQLTRAARLSQVVRSRLLLATICISLFPFCLSAQIVSFPRLKEQASQALRQGDNSRAIELYQKALDEDPIWTEGWWKYGGLLFGQERFQDALAAFTHLTRLAPENALGFAMLGMCEYELADWNNASLHLNKALSKGGLPTDLASSAMYDFGLSLMRLKNRNGALIAFRFVEHYAPDYPNLLPALGSAQLGLEQVPAVGTPDAAMVMLAGQAAMAVLRLKSDDAELLYRQLVQQYPRVPFVHHCFGLFLENLGREAEAEKEFKVETEINASSPEPWIWLAKIALARREAEQARIYAAHATRVSPNDGLCYLLSGRSYVLDKQWNKALEDLQKAEALSPDSYEVHNSLVIVYGELHDPQGVSAERKLLARTYEIAHPPDAETR